MYAPGEYDLAGFSVGVVARARIVDGSKVQPGDVVIGLPSSGLHSNGYSLARKVILEAMKLSYDDRPDVLRGATVGEALLAPTRRYARHVMAVMTAVDVHAMSHVTGGGIPANLPRVLPEGLGVRIGARWPRPPVFELVERGGGIDESEMRRTFNGGLGFLFVVEDGQADRARAALGALGEAPVTVGEVIRVPADRAFEERVEWPV